MWALNNFRELGSKPENGQQSFDLGLTSDLLSQRSHKRERAREQRGKRHEKRLGLTPWNAKYQRAYFYTQLLQVFFPKKSGKIWSYWVLDFGVQDFTNIERPKSWNWELVKYTNSERGRLKSKRDFISDYLYCKIVRESMNDYLSGKR